MHRSMVNPWNDWITFEEWTYEELEGILRKVDSFHGSYLDIMLECVENKDSFSHRGLQSIIDN